MRRSITVSPRLCRAVLIAALLGAVRVSPAGAAYEPSDFRLIAPSAAPTSPARSRETLRRDAEAGDAGAQDALGEATLAADPAEAVRLIRKAADQGLPIALYHLAVQTYVGRG